MALNRFLERCGYQFLQLNRILLLALISFAPIYWILQHDRLCLRCELSVMMPVYTEHSSAIKSSLSYKYRFFRYLDVGRLETRAGCIPMLFVPGSGGSYRQVRSLGSAIFQEQTGKEQCVDAYTVDFHGEVVPFTSLRLEQQAVYVNDACTWLVQKYSAAGKLLLVGHSFGGIVLRLLPTMANYQMQQVNHAIITISTPHWRSPFRLVHAMDLMYRSIENSLTESPMLSITSGDADIMVPPRISRCPTPSSNCQSQNVETIEDNWADPNHQAMVWERGTLRRLAKDIVRYAIHESDPKIPQSETIRTENQFPLDCMGMITLLTEGNKLRHGQLCPTVARRYCYSLASYNDKMELHFDASLNLALVIPDADSHGLHSLTSSPGRVFHFGTNTFATTQITQKINRVTNIGAIRGIVVDCRATILHKMDEAEWIELIDEGEKAQRHLLKQTFLELNPSRPETVIRDFKYSWRLIFGRRYTISPAAVKITLPEITFPCYFKLRSPTSDLRHIRLVLEDGQTRYGHLKDGKQGHFIADASVRAVELSFEHLDTMEQLEINLSVDVLGTLLRRIWHSYDDLFVSLFLCIWQRTFRPILIAKDALIFVTLNALKDSVSQTKEWSTLTLMINVLYSLWIVVAGTVVMKTTSVLPLLKASGRLRLAFVSTLPKLLSWGVEIRNLLVLAQEIGYAAVWQHEIGLPRLSLIDSVSLTAFLLLGNSPSISHDKLLMASALIGELRAPHQLVGGLLISFL